MSAPGITYSGVLAKKHANDSADGDANVDVEAGVFRGLKLWVSSRLPLRKLLVDTIQKNGGTVVLREGSADMLICNPIKDPMPGSYSYELIEDAVREGSLDIKEDYICSPSTSKRPKLTRNKFSEKDDRALMKFVTEMERLGENTGGNNIYKKFAEEHPHHTWQSWRDRWAKKLKYVARPPTSDGEKPAQQTGASSSYQHGSTGRGASAGTRAQFTPEEDDILLETIRHAINNCEPWNGFEPYKKLASEFPQRTSTSWRERALNYVARKHKDQIVKWELEATFRPSDDENVSVDNVEDQQTRTTEGKAEAKPPVTNRGRKSAIVAGSNRSPEKEVTEADVGEDNSTNVGLLPIPGAGSSKGSLRTRPPNKQNAPNHSPSSPTLSILEPPDGGVPITTREQFYLDYNTFLETSGVTDRRIIPSVAGKAISLWDLWQSVRSKKVEDAELDWQQIAEDLGFDWVSNESVPGDLQQCYEKHLAPFAEAMMSFNDSSDEDSAEANADAEAEETDGPLPSSPPALPSLKRRHSAISPVFKHLFPQSSPKRRRLDRSDEIPSTPDRVSRTWHLRSSNGPNKTPTTSPLNHHRSTRSAPRAQTRAIVEDEEDEEMRDVLADLPSQPSGRRRRLEPETQDFNFDPTTQRYIDDEVPGHSDNDSQRETTPSQQLLLEEATSPNTQYDAATLRTSQQKSSQITPTPRRKVRVPFQSDGAGDGQIQQARKGIEGARARLSTQRAEQKRRTLPASWVPESPADAPDARDGHPSSATVPETEPRRRTALLKETPDDIIDHFISLGYTRDIVLRSLKATSWIIGNAGQVMEMMKQGEPLPPRTTGVWTPRDDESLALVYSNEPPADEKAEKKRAKEMRRLHAKHGPDQIALRKRYLLDEIHE